MQQTIEQAERHGDAHRPAEPDARRWVTALAPYREPRLARSLVELFVTVVPFVALWFLMLASLRYSYWLCLFLAVPAAGFLVRLFMIQHDCGHGSFFRRRRANDWLGRVLGGADPHALQLLAAHACHAPRHLRPSGPARHGRRRHAERFATSSAL
jgi:Fatty acid desaturase